MGLPRRAGRARRGRWLLLAPLGASLGCATRLPSARPADRSSPVAARDACPTSLRAMAPRHARRWLWLRPRALFEHPRLGPLLSQLTRDAGERALVAEAGRRGVEVRTVDRALLVDRGDGSVSFAAGPFDARRVIDLHWDRMLPPRRRGDGSPGVVRIEGMLGGRPVAVATDAACGLLARAERDPRLVDRLIDRRGGGEVDPPDMIRWHIEGAPAGVEGAQSAALTATLRWTELRADPAEDGLRVTVVLAGPLPADTPTRMTRLFTAVAASPTGAAMGADDWLRPTDAAWSRHGDQWRGAFVIPWRGLRAIVSLARGTVEAPEPRAL